MVQHSELVELGNGDEDPIGKRLCDDGRGVTSDGDGMGLGGDDRARNGGYFDFEG